MTHSEAGVLSTVMKLASEKCALMKVRSRML